MMQRMIGGHGLLSSLSRRRGRVPLRLFASSGSSKFHSLLGGLWQSANESSPPAQPKMPPCDFSPQPYESYPYEQILKIREQNISKSVATYYKKPLLIHEGYMQWLFDSEGRRYLDLFGGIATISVGQCHPKITVAAQKQLGRLWHLTNIHLHSSLHEYALKLTALFPEPLKVLLLTNSGSEANDVAMLLARCYTQNFDIISLRGSYHGSSPYTLGLTGMGVYKFPIANSFGCHTTMCPDVYRGLWGGSHCRDSPVQTIRKCSCSPDCCEAKDRYIEQLKELLDTSVPKRLAGFIAEPIQGLGGVVQYPKGFLKEAYQLIRERGGVCIADEVQTGFARTGSHFWGFQSHDVIPDIVTMAKGIGNGFPMAAVVTSKEISDCLTEAMHFNTFGGNPVACVIGSAVLDVIEEEGLQKNSDMVGTYMLLELAKLRDKFNIIGDVRGKGLMIGVEMVTDQESHQPLSQEEINLIWEDCREMGVVIGRGGLYGQVFRMKPPLCITVEDVDFAIAVFSAALTRHMERRAAVK